ncbi:MAG: (E)-4-hydroxy-3-methylbut-2-enyl-diphosphate synthase [candidate division KSB1 bacterium]|nr:(E)-4-hydroxy-3-methylbut-2-enyl-diphosphate synthase [candidate division KSB1 bacterium]MDZ7300708.1 (E)-4-hydroxy-3-methylbut-2-enyl-diphosphate synthase [candidate division KSB1 bacterium]MDZ7310022.1 (E)-4-hydroxy-3-methylbut-2-enyl-diphosphate synthase [candidate division KSB1 bacterium]
MFTRLTYCESPFVYHRRPTHEVKVGDVGLGGHNPIRVQSMTIADTMDTAATVKEVIALAEAGCEIVRITAPSMKDAENLANIKAELRRQNIRVPLVADIHYTPNAALVAADIVEKVRINPGNYADKKKFEVREYSDAEYQAELERIAERFIPLVKKCKANGVAMRIGVNHGSLSDRIMNRYGDTPEGMVQSALEFIRICEAQGYRDIVVSMKSSNPQVMIQAYRLLAVRMKELGMTYPFHLGVTEAGDGEDGRIKSAVGIGALLEDGIGDTIRVSLTEDSIHEVPVAFALVKKFNEFGKKSTTSPRPPFPVSESDYFQKVNPYGYQRRETARVNLVENSFGGKEPVRVGLALFDHELTEEEQRALGIAKKSAALPILGAPPANADVIKVEFIEIKSDNARPWHSGEIFFQPSAVLDFKNVASSSGRRQTGMAWPLRGEAETQPEIILINGDSLHAAEVKEVINQAQDRGVGIETVFSTAAIANGSAFEKLRWLVKAAQDVHLQNWSIGIELRAGAVGEVGLARALVTYLDKLSAKAPLLWRYRVPQNYSHWLTDASSQLGALLCDGFGDAILIYGDIALQQALRFSYNLLQATRLRISKTEFISCPSCGRTLFNLQTTTARIKEKTGHLKGVKIAIMGCIVNGPGEMADADFGYVGAGPGKINLYVGKEIVEKYIPEELADEKLIELIKKHGKWVEAA